MRNTTTGPGQVSYTEQSGVFSGIRVTIANDGTAITTNQLIGCNVQVIKATAAGTQNICSGSLYALALASDPTQFEGNSFIIGTVRHTGLFIDFGGVVSIQGNDKLQVSVNFGSLPAGANSQVSTEYGIGVETYTPNTIVYQIDPTRSTFDLANADFVNSIVMLDTTAPGADAVPRIIGYTIKSDIWQDDSNFADIVAKIAQQWDTAPTRLAHFAYVGEELMKVSVTVNTNTSSTAQAFVVVNAGQTSQLVQTRALNDAKKFGIRAANVFTTGK